jgi:hypothetical protein
MLVYWVGCCGGHSLDGDRLWYEHNTQSVLLLQRKGVQVSYDGERREGITGQETKLQSHCERRRNSVTATGPVTSLLFRSYISSTQHSTRV